MYEFIEGKVADLQPMNVVVQCGGIGYMVHISLFTYEKIKDKKEVKLLVHLQVREDAWVFYGFADEAERMGFRQLLGINGVGAATARLILSSLSMDELSKIVATQDAKALEKVKGIGAKTAQRILLELKGKMLVGESAAEINVTKQNNTNREDALIALVNLGISKSAAEQAIAKAAMDGQTPVEEIIKQALRLL